MNEFAGDPKYFQEYDRAYGQSDMGWQCPKCGRVYAPCVSECWHCNANYSNIISTTVTNTIVMREDEE